MQFRHKSFNKTQSLIQYHITKYKQLQLQEHGSDNGNFQQAGLLQGNESTGDHTSPMHLNIGTRSHGNLRMLTDSTPRPNPLLIASDDSNETSDGGREESESIDLPSLGDALSRQNETSSEQDGSERTEITNGNGSSFDSRNSVASQMSSPVLMDSNS